MALAIGDRVRVLASARRKFIPSCVGRLGTVVRLPGDYDPTFGRDVGVALDGANGCTIAIAESDLEVVACS